MSLFEFRFKTLLEQSGKTQNEICKYLGISKQKLSKWKTGYNEPNLDDILILATYFNVSADYLLGLENEDGTKAKVSIVNHNNSNVIIGNGNIIGSGNSVKGKL